MKSKFLSLLKDFCLLSLLLLLGCSKDSATESPQLPERPNDVEPLPETVELAEGVVQLNNAQLAFVTDIDEGNTQLSFHNSLPEEYLPKVGELLLQMTPTEELPYGFVGRVTRITQQNGNYVVETEAPTLTEVFDKLYTEGEMQSMAETRAKDSEGYYTIGLNVGGEIKDTNIRLDGSYSAGFRPRQKVTIDKAKQKNDILFEFDTKQTSKLTLSISEECGFDKSINLGKGTVLSLTTAGLPIAACLQPYIAASASAERGVEVGLSVTERNSYSVEKSGSLLPVVKRTKESFSIDPSFDLNSKISAECYAGVGLRVEFRLFGRSDMAIGVGPEVGFKASGNIDMQFIKDYEGNDSEYDLLKDCSATVGGAARLSAYANGSAFGQGEWEKTLAEKEFNQKTYYLIPSFENASCTTEDNVVSARATVGRDLLLKADVGIAAWRGNKPSYGKAYPYQFEQEFSHNPITDQFSADNDAEYWTYAKIGSSYVKGVKLEDDESDLREMLIKFYHDTGGDNWTHNDNWCSDKPIDEWYGIDYNGKKLQIILYYNNLTGAGDLSGCTALENLYCYYNQLTSLNVSGCTALYALLCYDNRLTAIDVSDCTALGYLHCYNNQLTSLNVSSCTALTVLDCGGNQLASLNVSGFTALKGLRCEHNQLTSLDVSGCTALTWLDCEHNQLTSLDVSGYTAMTWLDCDDNQLTSLNVSDCTALTELYYYDNQLTSLDVSGCTALTELYYYDNQLTSLDVSGCTALKSLYYPNHQLTSLDVSGCTALEELVCYDNQLTSLNVSGCTALEDLDCYDNQLTSLDVSGCTALVELWCYGNQLTSLNVSGCTALEKLVCEDNQLTSLNVSGCTALEYLDCEDNPITQQVTAEFERIESFYCDIRYIYLRPSSLLWFYNYSDHHGWYYPDEPKSGYTYGGWDGTN